jgi:ribose 5-phosphate isomerase RpiB
MKLAITSDHAGYPLKTRLVLYLQEAGHEVLIILNSDMKLQNRFPKKGLIMVYPCVEVEMGLT